MSLRRPDFSLEAVVRPNIWKLQPYRCARDDYSEGILLDANENSFGPAVALETELGDLQLERYPDPHQVELKALLAQFRNVPSPDYFFLGVGSDESIDLIIRVFCTPAKDKILITPPTYGMYSVCAQVNDVGVVKVPLITEDASFQLDLPEMFKAIDADPTIKAIFLCSPGNPTSSLLKHEDIAAVLNYENFRGVVVVDEAYIDFCQDQTVSEWAKEYPNLIVTQTLSKSFGLAGIRLGIAIAQPSIARILNSTKAPYNISSLTSKHAIAALGPAGISSMKVKVASIESERARLLRELGAFAQIRLIGTNQANFVLAQCLSAEGAPDNQLAHSIYKSMAEKNKIVVRFRGNEPWMPGLASGQSGSS
ncbi:pyridoxal phosphate-dependent transferase [Polychytrium aggregatum]|uniref:pyridoxal phosphate-dependent transferase n=1 Tax=Polychytrium aggregatum TaxID=110093 RepID=UPI0022FEF2C4|nr:pyridoxal phosphate-dependent transferase [Polychytrium aggregatum]KAI9199403.1 pyridoxal phosphate-dependent transferase [Polychytrium aggregatum]